MTSLGLGLGLSIKSLFKEPEIDPDSIPGLVVDFDGADSANIVIGAGGVSSWTSKKGSSVMTQGTTSLQPDWDSGKRLLFSDDRLRSPSADPVLNGLNQYTVAYLAKFNAVNGDHILYYKQLAGGATPGLVSIVGSSVAGDQFFQHRGSSFTDSLTTPRTYTYTNPVGIILRRSGSRHGVIVDSEAEEFIAATADALSSGMYWNFGNRINSPQTSIAFNGYLYRILVYNRALTNDEVATILQLFDQLK